MNGAPSRFGPKATALAWALAAALAFAGAAARADDESEDHHHHHHAESAETGHGVTRSEQAYAVPEVQLRDTDGHPVAARSVLESDEPVMLDFIYTSCSAVCPMLSEIFAQVQRQLGPDAAKLRMVSITIDPDYDTPKVLARYAQTYHAGPQWRFLTGTTQDVSSVQQAFDAWKANKMDHAPLVFMRASRHSPWVRFEGLVDPGTLVRELRALNG